LSHGVPVDPSTTNWWSKVQKAGPNVPEDFCEISKSYPYQPLLTCSTSWPVQQTSISALDLSTVTEGAGGRGEALRSAALSERKFATACRDSHPQSFTTSCKVPCIVTLVTMPQVWL
jgi:hypothetical protein